MTLKELKELMVLWGWNDRDLAYVLGKSENAVWRWFKKEYAGKVPHGSTTTLLYRWLERARNEVRSGKKAKPYEPPLRKPTISKHELKELMNLTGWNASGLGYHANVGEMAARKWLKHPDEIPTDTVILLLELLNEAREQPA